MSLTDKLVRAPANYPDLVGRLVMASSFTGGAIKSYFGPGQLEDATVNYTNPTAWRSPGSLLKMPQVVWLSAPYPIPTNNANWVEGGLPNADNQSVSLIADPWGGPADWFGSGSTADAFDWFTPDLGAMESGWGFMDAEVEHYSSFIHNLTYSWIDDRVFNTVRDDFKTKFEAVKAAIEAVRPGKTWVTVNPWLWTALGSGVVQGYLHLVAPAASEAYVGTDFLHVYMGASTLQSTDLPEPSTTVANFRFTPLIEPSHAFGDMAAAKSAVHDDSVARVQAASNVFARYHVMLFGNDISMLNYDGGGSENWSGFGTSTTTYFEQEAVDLASYGVTYEGIGTTMTADQIQSKIAGHFGFDPGTGADL